jgi:hypothetical protein
MLQVIKPVPFELSIAVNINEYSEPIGSIIEPLPFIYISISMSHPAATVGLTPGPHPLILAPVGPELDTQTFSLPSLLIPLTLIGLALSNIFEFIYIDSQGLVGLDGFFFLLAMKTANSTNNT